MKNLLFDVKETLTNKTITRKIFFSYLVVNLLFIFIVGYVTLRHSTTIITEEAVNSTEKVLEQSTLTLNSNLQDVQEPLLLLAANPSVIRALNSYEQLNYEEKLTTDRNINEVLSNVSTFKLFIQDILIVGKNGYVNNLDSRVTLKWDYDFSKQQWFENAIRPNQRVVTPLGIHEQDYYKTNVPAYNEKTLSVSIPVLNYKREVIGSIICTLNIQELIRFFDLTEFEGGEIFLTDTDQTVLVHSNDELIGEELKVKSNTDQAEGLFIEDGQLLIDYPTSIDSWRMAATVDMAKITEHADPLKTAIVHLIYLFLGLNVLIVFIVTYMISRPVKRLLQTLDNSAEESLYVQPENYTYNELNQIGDRFSELMKRIRKLIDQNYVSELNAMEAEIKSLQSQINPHYLFNTLQLLQTEIVCGEKETSNQIIMSLSNQLRYTMNQSTELIEIEHELNYIKDYLYIINKKYDDRIEIDFFMQSERIDNYKILKLLIQPIVENSIKHGFSENPLEHKLSIHVYEGKTKLLICIKDNGKGINSTALKSIKKSLKNAGEKQNKIGLNNVNQRIKLKFGPAYGLRLKSKEHEYTEVFLFLPKVE